MLFYTLLCGTEIKPINTVPILTVYSRISFDLYYALCFSIVWFLVVVAANFLTYDVSGIVPIVNVIQEL